MTGEADYHFQQRCDMSPARKTLTRTMTPAKIVRNQKMLLHPRNLVNMSPRIGPRAGPMVKPRKVYAIYFPRSVLVTISATVATDTTVAPLLPKPWKQRRLRSAAKLFWHASPIFTPR